MASGRSSIARSDRCGERINRPTQDNQCVCYAGRFSVSLLNFSTTVVVILLGGAAPTRPRFWPRSRSSTSCATGYALSGSQESMMAVHSTRIPSASDGQSPLASPAGRVYVELNLYTSNVLYNKSDQIVLLLLDTGYTMEILEKLLTALADISIVRWLARWTKPVERVAYGFIFLFFFLFITINIATYICEFNRDDLNKTYLLSEVGLQVLAPRVLHNNKDAYELLISLNTLTSLTPSAIVAKQADNIVILPNQSLVFTITNNLYHSYNLRIYNIDAQWPTSLQSLLWDFWVIPPAKARITFINAAGLPSSTLEIEREHVFIGLLRQILPPISAALPVIGFILLIGSRSGGNMMGEQPKELVKAAELRQLLMYHFNKSELRTLCFDIAIDYENLSGQSKADKARELVAYVKRQGQIALLLTECQKIRPHVDWWSVVM